VRRPLKTRGNRVDGWDSRTSVEINLHIGSERKRMEKGRTSFLIKRRTVKTRRKNIGRPTEYVNNNLMEAEFILMDQDRNRLQYDVDSFNIESGGSNALPVDELELQPPSGEIPASNMGDSPTDRDIRMDSPGEHQNMDGDNRASENDAHQPNNDDTHTSEIGVHPPTDDNGGDNMELDNDFHQQNDDSTHNGFRK
jgi:hypothetical protein